jgi:hypothetical protein
MMMKNAIVLVTVRLIIIDYFHRIRTLVQVTIKGTYITIKAPEKNHFHTSKSQIVSVIALLELRTISQNFRSIKWDPSPAIRLQS